MSEIHWIEHHIFMLRAQQEYFQDLQEYCKGSIVMGIFTNVETMVKILVSRSVGVF